MPHIINLLRNFTINNQIKGHELLNLIKFEHGILLKEYRIRKICNHIRSNSLLPLISTSKGYYLSYDENDIFMQILSMKQRANAIMNAARWLYSFLAKTQQAMDNKTISRIDTIHPLLRRELRTIYSEICQRLTGGVFCRFTSVFRTISEQDKLYNQRPRVTWAKGGKSYHNYGLAVDICLITTDGKTAIWDTNKDFDSDLIPDWMECVSVFKKYGWDWGGDWKKPKTDNPHFQKTFGYSVDELYHKLSNKELDKYGYVKINPVKL